MYRGGRANATARRYARVWSRVFSWGLLPRRWVTLEVIGRTSGQLTRFPLGMADWHGQWYLVPMLGEQCNWVRNVRAAGGRAILRRRGATPCQLVELPVAERGPILRRYLQKVPGGRPHIPVDWHAPAQELAAVARQYPVFRVVPRQATKRQATKTERVSLSTRFPAQWPPGLRLVPGSRPGPRSRRRTRAAR